MILPLNLELAVSRAEFSIARSEAHSLLLKAMSCPYGQGYLFSRPGDAHTGRQDSHAERLRREEGEQFGSTLIM